ncbi:MAG TPA: PilZ domain-containing protein [Nitrospiria bacterium]
MASGTKSERRKHRRVTILQEVYFGEKKKRRLNDISEEGMFITTPEAFMKGSILDLSFRLFNDEKPIAVKGEVRYIEEGEGMGIRFVDLKPEDRERIRNFVKKF